MIFSKKYRMYIGHEDIHTICKVCDTVLDGYTITHGHGVWHGQHERCYIVEVILPAGDIRTLGTMMIIAESLKKELKQESILLTKEDVMGQFV